MSGIHLRAGRPDEAGLLSRLALRSKGHWGYPPEMLEQFRTELTVTPEQAGTGVIVAEQDGRVIGFAAVTRLDAETADLAFLFVEPGRIGEGIGRLLWHASLAEARRVGTRTMRVESDPHAEGFYLAMGARRVGETPSGSVPGRGLPVLEMTL